MAANKEQEKRVEGEAAIQASIEAMNGLDKEIGQKLHPIISENAPNLMPKTWYGMPAYANKEGKIVCFFRPAQRFNDRFLTLGFNDIADLDDGDMWPLSYAVKKLTPAVEQQIAELIKRAASE